jgi:hypothetical protein
MADKVVDREPWPLRAAGLALLGAVLATLCNLVLSDGPRWSQDPLRTSAASFMAVAGLSFAFTLEWVRPLWSLAFATVAGTLVALIFYWNGSPDGWPAGNEWRIFAALLVVAIAAPLFQSVRDEGRWRLNPEAIHAHAWTNIVLWFAAWAFVLISWLLAQLLAELFHLIGIDLLRDVLRENWFNAAVIGAALGGAIGLLRDRDKVLGLLQRVVTTVLSVLAPVLALGLLLFVLALPFTGLQPLWEKTTSTTPILIIATVGAFLLANAVIGNSVEEEAKGRVLALSAMGLGIVMAPLAVVAAISTWLRIDQHGFTPERLWAAIFVLAVLAVSITYAWAVIRGRLAWSDRVRPANVKLALAICALALLLATPLIDFGAISTRDQVARLQSGQVKPEEFDWAALRFDFGPSGRSALGRLRDTGPSNLRELAVKALASKNRWASAEAVRNGRTMAALARNLRVLPGAAAVPEKLQLAIVESPTCNFGPCTLIWKPGEGEAIAVGLMCERCEPQVERFAEARQGDWQAMPDTEPNVPGAAPPLDPREQRRGLAAGQVEIRPVQRRQVYVDGRPIGEPF